ncbi:MAG: hypothetical protein H6624_15660 [Bdellovibrionaceae bacterium]|nr:hypothetical protein [Bdellovibrionales bacterium]MCB9085783.1 hypothetical protein [Pseudobdellovibrionaceae bacterium]
MDAFLNFFISNLAVIIQWLIAVILLLVGAWFVLLIFGKGKNKSGEALDISDLGSLEATLKEIAQKGIATGSSPGTGANPAAVSSGGELSDAGAELAGAGSASMEKIMQELAQKEAEIQMLKASSPPEGAPEVDVSSYLEKIRDLEGKLAEYEIIEDDIADLSLYKEENARLKRQLEEMGDAVGATSGKVEEPVADEGKEEEEVAATGEKGEDLVKEFAQAVEVGGTAAKPDETTNEIDSNEVPSGDLTSDLDVLNEAIAEVEAAASSESAEDELTGEGDVPVPELADEAPAAVEEEAPPVVAAASAEPQNEEEVEVPEDSGGDDILAEFTRTLTDSIPELNEKKRAKEAAAKSKDVETDSTAFVEEMADTGSVDTNKMLAEMAELEAVGEADDNGESALEGEVDTDQLAAEASKLISGE